MANTKERIRQDADRSHNAPVLGDGKHKPTGLKEAALEDWNKRLVTDPNKQR